MIKKSSLTLNSRIGIYMQLNKLFPVIKLCRQWKLFTCLNLTNFFWLILMTEMLRGISGEISQ